MAENNYDIDQLLAELKAKRMELEKSGITLPEPAETDGDGTKENFFASLLDAPASDSFLSGKKPLSKAEELRRMVAPEQENSAAVEETQADGQDEETVIPKISLRNLREQLTGSYDSVEQDEFTGTFRIGHPDETETEPEDEEPVDEQPTKRPEDIENHPIFSTEAADTNVIPVVPMDGPDKNVGETISFNTTELLLTAEQRERGTGGVLNFKNNNMEESFKEFFGDTVVVEHSDTSRKNEVTHTVFDDELDEPVEEYSSEAETEQVRTDLMAEKSRAMARSVATGVVAAVLLIVNLFVNTKALPFLTLAPAVFYGLNAVLMLVAVVINMPICSGVLALFKLRAELTSMVGLSAWLSLIQPVVLIATKAAVMPLAACISATALFCCDLAALADSRRVLDNFAALTDNRQKYASVVLADQDFTRSLTHGLHTPSPSVLIKRRTGFSENFLAHSASQSGRFDNMRRLQPIFALLCVILALITLLKKEGIGGAFTTAALCAAMCAPFFSLAVSAHPMRKLQKKLRPKSAVLPGYSAAEELAGANCVLLEGRELFPRDKVLLHGIKTFDEKRVDKSILYAASVLIHSCDTMSHMFLKVIQGKTDMLFQAESVVYEEGLGFSFWVDQNRILVGRRELLEAHEIEVPSRDYENRYTKTSTRDAIYLAVAGKLHAMFVISYAPDEEMAAMLQQLVKHNINIIVRTRDFIISADKIARMYNIPRTMVTIVRESNLQDLAKKTVYSKKSPSSLTHGGSVSAFLGGLTGSHDLLSLAALCSKTAICCMTLGGAIAAILTLLSSFSTVGLVSVLGFQLLWTALHILLVELKKY